MKAICWALAGITLACAFAGCGEPKASKTLCLERQEKYQRVAIVCAPKAGADPSYASQILKQVERNVPTRLGFLKAATCLFDVSVDTASTPPTVRLDNAGNYDAVVCLVYSHAADKATLDFHMLETGTGREIWTHQFDTAAKPSVKERLLIHGLWAPSAIKNVFYCM